MKLTAGAIQFFWSADRWARFYDDLVLAPVDSVILGELVCSKRLPFYQDRIPQAVEALQAAGKHVALTSLAVVTLKRERNLLSDLFDLGVEVEVNDLTALAYLPEGSAFSVGPLVNVYNESTLGWLAAKGATRICLPPELPLNSIEILATAAKDLGVEIEVWGHGRIPLAISGRCYHARLHGRTKDNCQFACEDDPDGKVVRTLDNQPFLSMNGVQTLSESHACVVAQVQKLANAGVSSLRLSPQSKGFLDICRLYRALLDGRQTSEAVVQEIRHISNGIRLSDGFLAGAAGVDWSGKTLQPHE
ncbi:U32 family peptidase [Cognatishimia sp. WU-CL00825]|uniref:ubiquinone anaerobic biosynthesis protein UbiV n=1 Tax=Cognatishimia sp. WU-CL00825 TaxID=3127658 RepID=UPI00310AFDD4